MFAFSGDQGKKRPSNGQTEVGWDLPGMIPPCIPDGTPSANSVVIGTHPGCDRRGLWGRGALPSSQTQQVQGFILPSGLQLDAHGGRAAGELEAEEKSAAWGWASGVV